jgi:ketosteroid isomerase-like protein
MSAEEVALVESFFVRMNEGGVDAITADIHPDFEFTTPADLASEPGTYRGEEGLRRWFDTFYEAMDQVRVVPLELADVGPGLVAVALELQTRGRSTGLELSQRLAALTRLRDDMAWRLEFFPTLDEAVAGAKEMA